MVGTWYALYLILAVAAIAQAVLMAVLTWENRRFARNRLREMQRHHPTGRALVLAPCKGLETGLQSNLEAVLTQDYDDYQVTFIVDRADDPACPLIRRAMARHPQIDTRLIVAGKAAESGQKIHNLRAATADVPDDVEYLVFVDSDARPRAEWLRSLISRLGRPNVGAASGYRWFLPARPSLANHLLYSINCGIALLPGRRGNLIWGGSWAIRRELFDSLGVRQAWRGMLSDDLVVSRLIRRRGLKILFEPPCMVVSPLDQRLGEMCRFIRRQYLVSRCNVPLYWALALGSATVVGMVWLSSLAMIACGLVLGSAPVGIPLAVCGALYALGAFRNGVRQDLGRRYFPHLAPALQKARRFDIWAAPLTTLVNWAGLVSSLVGRQMVWRGIRYRLLSGGGIQTLGRLAAGGIRYRLFGSGPLRTLDRSAPAELQAAPEGGGERWDQAEQHVLPRKAA